MKPTEVPPPPPLRCWVALAVAAMLLAATLTTAATAQTELDWLDEVVKREQLIADQANLIDSYRCLFGRDGDLVLPGLFTDPLWEGQSPPPPDVLAELERERLSYVCGLHLSEPLFSYIPDPVFRPENRGFISGGEELRKNGQRDQIIADQENVLNTYRCEFDIDTHAVAGGCDAQSQRPAAYWLDYYLKTQHHTNGLSIVVVDDATPDCDGDNWRDYQVCLDRWHNEQGGLR